MCDSVPWMLVTSESLHEKLYEARSGSRHSTLHLAPQPAEYELIAHSSRACSNVCVCRQSQLGFVLSLANFKALL